MLSKSIETVIDNQINAEWYSAYLYLDMSSYFNNRGLEGFGNWYYVQAREEQDHALLFTKYLLKNNIKPVLQDIKASNHNYNDFREPLDIAYLHERKVTESLNNIFIIATLQGDDQTIKILNWYLNEQKEEEENTDEMITDYDKAMKDSTLSELDDKYEKRVYKVPTLVIK